MTRLALPNKVSLFDRRVGKVFLAIMGVFGSALSLAVIFIDIPSDLKLTCLALFLTISVGIYFAVWFWANNLNHIAINVEGSTVVIKVGDLFEQPGFKAIAFNEFFDTQVDDQVIAGTSLNGVFIRTHLKSPVPELDQHIEKYPFDPDEIIERQVDRNHGKTRRYKLGTICVYNDFLLTAFSRFDANNRAVLTMPEYLDFLVTFWDRVNKVYAQKSVSTAVFGSGITRIKGHKNISDEDLLKIMLWTFRISEMRFKYPARLSIIVHKDKIDQINLLGIKAARDGL